jgi:hypothetical protein
VTPPKAPAKRPASAKAAARDRSTAARLADLEHKLDTVVWLHRELVEALRLQAVKQLQQQLASSPEVTEALLARLNGSPQA